MKNNDYKFVQRIIEYCDIINDLVDKPLLEQSFLQIFYFTN